MEPIWVLLRGKLTVLTTVEPALLVVVTTVADVLLPEEVEFEPEAPPPVVELPPAAPVPVLAPVTPVRVVDALRTVEVPLATTAVPLITVETPDTVAVADEPPEMAAVNA